MSITNTSNIRRCNEPIETSSFFKPLSFPTKSQRGEMNNTTIESPEVLGSGRTHRDFFYGFVISLGVLIIIIFLTYAANMFNRMYHPPQPPPSSDRTRTTVTEAGLDEATLVTFPSLLYSDSEAKPHKGESTASSSGCSICLADYKATDMLRLLPECGHMYHLKCIDQWLRLHPTCPICRNSPLPTPLATPHQSLQVDHISRLSVVDR